VLSCDWLPGTVAAAWGLEGRAGRELVKGVTIKEHFARRWGLHPRQITLDPPFAIAGKRRARYDLRFDASARSWSVGDDPHE
jgi:hypothetical protein